MPVTRSLRQLGNTNRLENLGNDRAGDQGDHIAAFRASADGAPGAAQPAAMIGAGISPITAPTINAASPGTTISAAGFTELGFGDNPYHLNAASLSAIGFGTNVGAFSKLQYGLAEIFIEAQMGLNGATGAARAAALEDFASLNHGANVGGGYVAIDAVAANGDGAALLAALEVLGLERGASYGRLAGGLMPIDMLDELASLDLLASARPVYAMTNVGSTTSQNVVSMNGDYLQSMGLTGAGITIGVMSDSFNTATITTSGGALTIHYAQDQTSGDLPAGINILADLAGANMIDEGRAMSQLINDMAPGATLQFHTAFVSTADFAQGIMDLVNAGSKIVVDDVIYFGEPMFQDGAIAQAVGAATAAGAMYFSSAGNNASFSYQSEFRHSGQFISLPDGNTYEFHDFDPGPGIDTQQSFAKAGTVTYTLNWDQPNFSVSGGAGSQSNMAWLLINSAGGGSFTSTNNIAGDAVEIAQSAGAFVNLGLLLRVGDPVPGLIKYVLSGSVAINEFATNSGTAYGHTNAATALSVGAVDWGDSMRFAGVHTSAANTALSPLPYLESFSSRGDVPILFDTLGNRLAAPEYRTSVDFSAGDGGNNTFFGSDVTYDADSFGNFFGTSAAAPNAAAVAALLMQAFPSATRAQIETALKQSAIDVQFIETNGATGAGFDNISGHGFIQADRAYNALKALLSVDTIVGAGEAAIISYETDTSAGGSPDGLRFVLLSDIAAGTVIYITDRAWTGSAFTNAAGEGTYVYTAGGAQSAGTIVTLSASQLSAVGITLSNAGETIYMYQGGQDAPTRFLFAVDVADGNATFTGNLTGTGLTNGVNAVAIAFDNASYAGSSTQIPQTQLQDMATSSRWHGTDTDDIAGTTFYTEVQDTTVQNTFTNPDMVMIAGMAGGGQSDAILRIGNDEGANVGSHLARLFRDNPAFNHISDISFDLENGFFFFLDSDFNSINRIMRGNIADLVSGVSNPTFTQLFATDGQNNGAGPVMLGEGISSLEINTTTNKLYWVDGSLTGDFEGGWEVYSMNYDGTGRTLIATIDTENDTSDPGSLFGVTGVADYAVRTSTNIMYIVGSLANIDGLGVGTVRQNHLMSVNLTTGAIATINMGAADPRTTTGGGFYDDGRLDPNEGQIIGIDVSQTTGIIYFVTQPIGPDKHGGIFSYNPATDTLVELWEQPTNDAFNTLQTFPTNNMTFIEVDEIGGRLYISTLPDSDSEFDATPGINEDDASIFSLAIGAVVGTAPTLFKRVVEVTANGGPVGMEIDYAPVTGATTANATYTESTNLPASPAGPVIAPVTAVSVTDADNTLIQGATIAITDGYFAGDQLSITVGGSGLVATIDNTRGLLTLTGLATLAQYQTVMASVRYTNAGDNPTNYGNNTTRTISFTTFDGLANSDPVTANLTVVGINDAPVNTVPGAAATLNEDNGLVLTGMSVADPDADPANQDIQVTLHVNHGTITIFTGLGTGVQVSDLVGNGTATVVITATQNQINATFAHATGVTYLNTLDFNGADLLTITTNDLGFIGNDPGLSGTGTSEQDQDTRAINITPVNDAPVVAGDGTEDSLTIFEDQPSATGQTVSSLFLAQFTDQRDNQIPNGGVSVANTFIGIAVVANASSGATGQWQYLNGAVWTDIGTASLAAAKLFNDETQFRFNPALNYNGAEPLLTVRLVDSSGGASVTDAQVVDISAIGATGGTSRYSAGSVVLGGSITAVNDAPTSTALSGDAATWTEGGAAALLDVGSNMTIADVDSANFDTGTLTVHIGAGLVAAQDQLGITNQGNGAGQIGVGAGTVSFGGTQFATFTGGGAGGSDLSFIFDPDATQAAVQALMRAINYSNSGGDNPTAGSRAIVWTLVDGDGIANSGADTLVVNSSVNVVAVNDAPSGTNHTASFNEDSTYTFASADFGFTDVDGNSFSGVRFTTLPLLGTIFLDTDGAGGAAPIAVSAGDIIALSEIQAGHVYYVPAANGNGTNYANFTFQVRDNGGTTGGGVDLDQSPNLFTFDVASVNDAPTSILLNGNTAIWVEGSSPVLLDVGSNGTIADIDSADFDTGTLTVHIINPVAAQDQLGIVNQGNGVGQIGVGAGTVSLGGVQFATFTGGGAGGLDLVFTFDPDATPAAVQALVHAINYTNSGGISPTAGIRNVRWTLVDGDGIANGGADTLILNSSVAVQAINDAPTGTDNAVTINEDATYVLTAGTFGYGDVNGDLFTGVVVTTIPVPGTLLYDADGVGGAAAVAVTAGQFISASEIALGHLYYSPVANGNGVPFSSFTFQVRDDGGTGNGGQDTDQSANTLTFNVTALNDAPVNNVPGTQTINEDSSFTLSNGNGNAIQVSDVDATTLNVTLSVAHGTMTIASTLGLTFSGGSDGTADTTMTFSGTAAAINAALGAGLTYTATGNYNGPDALSVVTDDGGETGAGGTQSDSDSITINITSVNDAPSGADKTVSGSEDDPYVFTAADFGFTDPADGNAFAAISVITFPGNGKLFLDSDGPGGAAPIDLSTVGSGVFVGINDINLGHLYFQPDPDEFGTNYATFTFKVQDDGGGATNIDPTANTITINIAADNFAPIFDLDSGTGGVNVTLGYTENDAATVIAPSATLTDDSPDFDTGSLTVSFTANGTAADTLAIRNQGTGVGQIGVSGANVTYGGVVIGTFTGGTGGTNLVITFNASSSAAAGEALLHNITYANGSDNPSALARTVHFAIADGDGGTSTADATINFTAVDDPGIAQPDAFVTTESALIVAGNVFTDHGSGPDTDLDNALVVGAVNGSGANVGVQITLASGALLTLGSNGLFNYNPNGAFDPTPTPGSGASNTPGHDSFTYTLAGGNTVTVSITLTGLDTNDLLLGTGGPDVLSGGLGNDTYVVDGQDVVLESAGQGFDQVYATANFGLSAGTSVEVLSASDWAAASPLILYGNEISQQIFGNAGANYIDGGGEIDSMYGFGGNDTYVVDDAFDAVFEGAGQGFDQVLASVDYTLRAGVEVEVLSAGDWSGLDNLALTGNAFGQQIFGNAGSNVLNGGGGADSFFGFGDDDIYLVQSDDLVFEGAGQGYDQVYTDSGFALAAGQEIEVLSTNDWSATAGINLTGNEFTQQIFGNAGQNFINGGAGADFLFGFGGDDRFVFNTALGGTNVDNIADFTTGHDQIWMDNAVFTGLSDGLLATGAFFIGTAAHDADDRIIYNNATGALLYDADGNGAGAAIQFATLSTGLTPVATDFFVI